MICIRGCIACKYDSKILDDVEQGYKNFVTLDKCIDPTAWNYARELVPIPKIVKPSGTQNQKSQNLTQNSAQNTSQKMCTTYNTFKKGEGCSWEYNNPGEVCVYLHSCSSCRQRGFPNRRHKSINCRDDAKLNNSNQNVIQNSAPVGSVPPVVTTSV